MKKIIIILALLLFPVVAFAQTFSVSSKTYGHTNSVVVICEWEADGLGAVSFDIDNTTETEDSGPIDLTVALLGKYCGEAFTVPAIAPDAPTADYDITVMDGYILSIFGTALADRSATATESTAPQFVTPDGNIYGGRILRSAAGADFETYSITITNAGAGGKGIFGLVFR